jgi:hypothetical protein
MVVRLSVLRTSFHLPPGRFLVIISVRGWVDPRAIVRLKGLRQLKNPMTSRWIETATFRLVAQCLNKLRYRVTHSTTHMHIKMLSIFTEKARYTETKACSTIHGLLRNLRSCNALTAEIRGYSNMKLHNFRVKYWSVRNNLQSQRFQDTVTW